jgi:hypothetical protein
MKSAQDAASESRRPSRSIEEVELVWRALAGETLDIMLKGGDPSQTTLLGCGDDPKRFNAFNYLHNLTRVLSPLARARNQRFDDVRLWKFVECVHRWCCGYRTAADFVAARTALSIAETELNQISLRSKKNKEKPTSTNESRDQFIFDQYKSGHSLKKIRERINQTNGWSRLGTDVAIRNAINRYCKRHQVDVPTRKRWRIKRN